MALVFMAGSAVTCGIAIIFTARLNQDNVPSDKLMGLLINARIGIGASANNQESPGVRSPSPAMRAAMDSVLEAIDSAIYSTNAPSQERQSKLLPAENRR